MPSNRPIRSVATIGGVTIRTSAEIPRGMSGEVAQKTLDEHTKQLAANASKATGFTPSKDEVVPDLDLSVIFDARP